MERLANAFTQEARRVVECGEIVWSREKKRGSAWSDGGLWGEHWRDWETIDRPGHGEHAVWGRVREWRSWREGKEQNTAWG